MILLPLLLCAAPIELGPIPLAPALAVYLVSDATPTDVTLTVRQGGRSGDPRLMIRVLDPDENLAHWQYVEYVPAAEAAAKYSPGIDLRDEADAPPPGEPVVQQTFRLDQPGVWQVRVLDGAQDAATAELSLSRDLPWGYSGQNGDFTSLDKARDTWYAWVPPRAELLHVNGGPMAITDAAGKLLRADGAPNGDVAVTGTEQVWTFRTSQPKAWKLRAAGFPLLLCPTPEAAQAIRASVVTARGGLIVSHQAQAAIAALLPDILANCGQTDALLLNIAERRDAWLADPVRNQQLASSYLATVPFILPRQNLDPNSPFAGSLDGWQSFAEKGETWNRLRDVDGLWGGISKHYGGDAEFLALAATRNDPPNPWFGREELVWRAAAAAMADLLMVAEDETFYGTNDLDPYPGMSAFVYGQKTFPVFEAAAPHLPAPVREAWKTMLRKLVERSCVDYLTSARNQSSHYLVAYQAFANGSDDPLFQDLAKVFARRWIRGASPGGYHQEATGPCSSYIGMTHWHEAVYYRQSNDPEILESMRRSYTFFNHTVAPEPDGRMLGGFNYNHRVGEGFYGEQWSGAKGIVGDVLPEVGLWSEPVDDAQRAEAIEQLQKFLANPTEPLYAAITTPRYVSFAPPDKSLVWPAQETKPFIRNFADQLVAVKRPGYYANIYVGHPAAGNHYIQGRENLRQPFANSIEDTGGELPDMRKVTPFLGGGLTGFWTPAYGHAIMAADWSPTTHHGLIATMDDGRRTWEDYFKNSFQLDEAAGTLTIDGEVELLPLKYTRRYRFADDRLAITLTVTATEACQVNALVESLPIVKGEWKSRGVTITAGGQTQGEIRSDRVRLADGSGAAVEAVFAQPQALRILPDGLRTGGWRKLAFGRVEVQVPATWTAGQSVTLEYALVPQG